MHRDLCPKIGNNLMSVSRIVMQPLKNNAYEEVEFHEKIHMYKNWDIKLHTCYELSCAQKNIEENTLHVNCEDYGH